MVQIDTYVVADKLRWLCSCGASNSDGQVVCRTCHTRRGDKCLSQ